MAFDDRCNGIVECDDSSDEKFCDASKFIRLIFMILFRKQVSEMSKFFQMYPNLLKVWKHSQAKENNRTLIKTSKQECQL